MALLVSGTLSHDQMEGNTDSPYSSGRSGYGKFDIENFTVKRNITVHPANAKYPLVDF